MRLALIGSDIPSLLPALLADLLFSHKAEGHLFIHDSNPAQGQLLSGYAGRVIQKSGVKSKVTVSGDLAAVLSCADAVIYADSTQNGSRFRMDLEALSGVNEGEAGLKNQARLSGGIGGLLFALRSGEKALQLCQAMHQHCPKAQLINLTEPLNPLTALINTRGFHCLGMAPFPDKRDLCAAINKKPALIQHQAAGLYRFMWLTGMSDSGKDLYTAALRAVKNGAQGDEHRHYALCYDAIAIGPGHGDSLPENPCYMPDFAPVLSETIERRKERMRYMYTIAKEGLQTMEAELSQLALLKTAASHRPIQCLLEAKAFATPVVRANKGSIAALPPQAMILALQSTAAIRLPDGVADVVAEVACAQLLMAHAATGDTEALREWVDTAPALTGLDRLYLHALIPRLVALHGDVLPRFSYD